MIAIDEILPPNAYARVRSSRAATLNRHRSARRVELGDYLCLLFEDRDTVLAQIQEVVYVEGRTNPAHVQREIDDYACLLPSPGVLTATLTIHAGPPKVGAALSNELRAGLGPIALEVGTRRYPCVALQPCDPIPAAVHYIGFAVDDALLPSLRSPAPAWLRLRSTIEQRDLPLPQPLRTALIDTLSLGGQTTPHVLASNAGSRDRGDSL